MKRIFLDASVIMEIMFARQYMEKCLALIQGKDKEFYISSLTVHLIYHFGEQGGLSRNFVRDAAAICGHLPLTAPAIKLAQKNYTGKDFEDCLQAACAQLNGCDGIYTLDKKFARLSGTKLPVKLIN